MKSFTNILKNLMKSFTFIFQRMMKVMILKKINGGKKTTKF